MQLTVRVAVCASVVTRLGRESPDGQRVAYRRSADVGIDSLVALCGALVDGNVKAITTALALSDCRGLVWPNEPECLPCRNVQL